MTSQVNYTANGSTVVFPYSFAIPAKTALEVLVNNVVQDVGFHITGASSQDGGNVVFVSAPAEGDAISLRYLGGVTISAQDATAGHLSDKLAAGTGVTLETVIEPGGIQRLKVNAVASADALKKANNLDDLPDLDKARENLGVFSTQEVIDRDNAVTSALQGKLAGLSGVTDVIAARTKLGVYSTQDVIDRDNAVTSALEGKLAGLSGVTDVGAARTKLGVSSTQDVIDRDIAVTAALVDKLAGLSGVTDVTAALTKLGLDRVAYLNAAQDWTAPQRSQAVQTASVGGSVALNFDQYQNFDLTLTDNITFANPTVSAAMIGQKGTIGIIPGGFAIVQMGSQWKRVGTTGNPGVITGMGRIDYHIRALGRIEYAYNDVEA